MSRLRVVLGGLTPCRSPKKWGGAEMQEGFPIGSGTLLVLLKWAEGESNPRHQDFQSCALPTELSAQTASGAVSELNRAKELFSGAGC